MEEVPAHHEHRSGLIWSGDHETCYSDLQCRRFGGTYSSVTVRFPTYASRLLWEFGSCVYLSLLEDIDAIKTYCWALGGARQIGGPSVRYCLIIMHNRCALSAISVISEEDVII
ncbi:hypothetical protein M9H77_02166 [Catharanthus roseus]|uniref:Uncharacterized protein n=1 Tax=Catharanthus roseus TaxID=4058 RepID=A0ACC0C815_CATRO|nr:hypothetical protein M9H77_02166 [Catharanthus roseus]